MKSSFLHKLIIVSTLTLALGGCASPGSTPPTTAESRDPLATAQALIIKARSMSSPQAEELLIDASNQLIDQGKLEQAKSLLLGIDPTTLPAAIQADRVLALSHIAIDEQRLTEAAELLTTDNYGLLTISTSLDTDRLNKISLLRAQVWEAQDNFMPAARERIFVSPMLEAADDRKANHDQIWQDLIQLPVETLDSLTHTIAIPEIQGWLELAWIYKGQQDDMDAQLKAIHSWQQRFAGHPAATELPESVRMLTELSSNKPQRIALLLPLQGKYRQSALAVQTGFLTAHFAMLHKLEAGSPIPEVTIYDTSDSSRFLETYQQAVREGADAIVGPLQKENVHQLSATPQVLPVTTIALNTDETTATGEVPDNLFQFGLTPEEDAGEVAKQAMRDQMLRAAVLYQLSPWGERALAAFRDNWTGETSQLNATGSFDSAQSLASAIKRMLLVDQSEARAQQLKRIIGRTMEFQPRRRQDIDFIYLVATPEQGRLIKPLLNFYFAENLPVYSGSQIYAGDSNPEKDRDLDGILFCDIPWMLEKPDSMKKRMLDAWPKSNPRFFRLNALGVDAYRLQARIQLLKQVPGAGLFGATGNLTVGEQNRIQRGLDWASFKNGQVSLLPRTNDASNSDANGNNKDRQTTKGQSGGSDGSSIPRAEGI